MFKFQIKNINKKIVKDADFILDKIGDFMVEDSNNKDHDLSKEEALSKFISATILAVSTSAGCPIICPPAVADGAAKIAITKIADPIENKIGKKLEND